MVYFSRKNFLNASQDDFTLEARVMLMGTTTLRPSDSLSKISSTLSKGGNVTFAKGDYTFGKSVDVRLGKTDLNVTATGANFISDGVNGNLFTINGGGVRGTKKPTIEWKGGTFDIRNQRLSTTRPLPKGEKAPDGSRDSKGRPKSLEQYEKEQKISRGSGTEVNKLGTRATADAIHVRGNERIKELTIDRIEVKGSDKDWRTAGGDSGVFVTDVDDVTIKNSKFKGLRDAGIYVSDTADEFFPAEKGKKRERRPRTNSVELTNNLVEDSYDGITAKRGVDNVNFQNNVLIGNEVGASLKINGDGRKAGESFEDASFVGNFISESGDDALFLEETEGVDSNTFKSNRVFLDEARDSKFKDKRERNVRTRNADEITAKGVKDTGNKFVTSEGIAKDSGVTINNGFASKSQEDAAKTTFRQRGGFTG
jgi:hypothetical protein